MTLGQQVIYYTINITNDEIVEDTEQFHVTIEIIPGTLAMVKPDGARASVVIEDDRDSEKCGYFELLYKSIL